MALPFSRSTRSLQQDRFLPGLVAIGLICALLAGWMLWFLAGELALYASTTEYTVLEDGTVLARFPPAARAQIRPGQAAELRLPGVAPIRAEVLRAPADAAEPVEIYLFAPAQPPQADAGRGQVKVLLGRTSPVRLLWNSIQQ